MQFIDFEYSAYSYRGFDFGNHFNEYAGFECDYTRCARNHARPFHCQNYFQCEFVSGLPMV